MIRGGDDNVCIIWTNSLTTIVVCFLVGYCYTGEVVGPGNYGHPLLSLLRGPHYRPAPAFLLTLES